MYSFAGIQKFFRDLKDNTCIEFCFQEYKTYKICKTL